jgi:hypothetical protein
MTNFNRSLPIIQGISERIYKQTPTPINAEDCQRLIREFRNVSTDIAYQLQLRDKEAEGYYQWKKTALHKQRIKLAQITILQAWYAEYCNENKTKNQQLQKELNSFGIQLITDLDEDNVSAGQIKRELKWLRSCVGALYDVVLNDELDDEDVREKLEKLADALNWRE